MIILKLFLSDWAIFQVEVYVMLFFPVSFSLVWFVGRVAHKKVTVYPVTVFVTNSGFAELSNIMILVKDK